MDNHFAWNGNKAWADGQGAKVHSVLFDGHLGTTLAIQTNKQENEGHVL